MRLTYDVKARAFGMGTDLVGIAPVDRFEHAPEGGKPQYYMPDAKCVVVIATRILKGVCDVHGSYKEEGKTIGPYGWHGYPMLNWFNSWTAIQVGKLLEDNGYKALPFTPTGAMYRYPDKDLADFSHRHAAVAAGLGEFGLSSLLLTPEFGPRVRMISIVTNAPLDPDPMYSGPRLCRREECNDLCINACPVGAFEGNKLVSAKIGDKVFEYVLPNHKKHLWFIKFGKYLRGAEDEGFPRFPPKEFLEETKDSTKLFENLKEKMHPYDRALSDETIVAHCGGCIIKCPSPWK